VRNRGCPRKSLRGIKRKQNKNYTRNINNISIGLQNEFTREINKQRNEHITETLTRKGRC
jgi:hypothetical protein